MWQGAVISHRGRLRRTNEDSVSIDTEIMRTNQYDPIVRNLSAGLHVLMIADGIGGQRDGALASLIALQSIIAIKADDLLDPSQCERAIRTANDQIYDRATSDAQCLAMGTTLVGCAINADQLLVFNVGNRRCYLHTTGQLLQVSLDDVPPSSITGSRARQSNAITQSLGGTVARNNIRPHVSSLPPLAAGETVLLCSDGLTDMINETNIEEILNGDVNIESKVSLLNRLAMAAGGQDNLSILTLKIRV